MQVYLTPQHLEVPHTPQIQHGLHLHNHRLMKLQLMLRTHHKLKNEMEEIFNY